MLSLGYTSYSVGSRTNVNRASYPHSLAWNAVDELCALLRIDVAVGQAHLAHVRHSSKRDATFRAPASIMSCALVSVYACSIEYFSVVSHAGQVMYWATVYMRTIFAGHSCKARRRLQQIQGNPM